MQQSSSGHQVSMWLLYTAHRLHTAVSVILPLLAQDAQHAAAINYGATCHVAAQKAGIVCLTALLLQLSVYRTL
jgi:hypothetical protein